MIKKQDFIFALFLAAVFLPFVFSETLYNFLFDPETGFNTKFPLLTSFIKFAILATSGELLGLRILTGKYFKPGFGIFPRAVVWGILGVAIKIAFVIFIAGTTFFAEKYLGFQNAKEIMHSALSIDKIIIAILISTFLNLFFAPVFMTFHKITDTHILFHEGKLKSLYTPIKMGEIIENLNWKIQWNFIIKKTIPLFWIPAQAINFCFPEQYQILNAAILGIVLGVILAIANLKK